MANKLKLTRNQLAQFLSDHESIKQFEKLFSIVDALAPDFVNEVLIAAETAGSRATQALDALQRLSNALELLALAPVAQSDETKPYRITEATANHSFAWDEALVYATVSGLLITLPKAALHGPERSVLQAIDGVVTVSPSGTDTLVLPVGTTISTYAKGSSLTFRPLNESTWGIV